MSELQDDQSSDRRICTRCAYEKGSYDALNENDRKLDISYLPQSQAGTVRHKGVIEAYREGYDEELRRKEQHNCKAIGFRKPIS